MAEVVQEKLAHRVDDCPRCHAAHDYTLFAVFTPTVPTFAGRRDDHAHDVILTCPDRHGRFSVPVTVPRRAGWHLSSLTAQRQTSRELQQAQSERVDTAGEQLADSLATARDFVKVMLTTALASIPAYFAVLKYLGVAETDRRARDLVGLLPPVLFLVSAAVLVQALRPMLIEVGDAGSLVAGLSRRSRVLNRRIEVSAGTLIVAYLLTLVVFAVTIWTAP